MEYKEIKRFCCILTAKTAWSYLLMSNDRGGRGETNRFYSVGGHYEWCKILGGEKL